MKYNLSQIMTRAWELKRCNPYFSFSKCLHLSWDEAKAARRKAEQAAREDAQKGQTYHKGMVISIGGEDYSLNRWQGYGKDRIYLNQGVRSFGYLDVRTGRVWNTPKRPRPETLKAIEILATIKVA